MVIKVETLENYEQIDYNSKKIIGKIEKLHSIQHCTHLS